MLTGLVLWSLLLALISSASFASDANPAPILSCELTIQDGNHQSTDGVVDLKWGEPECQSSYELQAKQPDGDFVTRYRGEDHSSVLTGLSEGLHLFRVGRLDANGQTEFWSEPLKLRVEYMPAERVRLLLLLGGLVVIATTIAILHGHFSHRAKEVES